MFFFIIYHKTREIVRYAVTENPVREFVRQQLIEFENEMNRLVYLIHDNALQFNLHYLSYSIKGIATSVKSPNMNSYAERFVLSVRQEAFDNFIIISYTQVRNILDQYISYYNFKRPHQRIDQKVPKNYKSCENGKIVKLPVLSGLHHHYYRKAA